MSDVVFNRPQEAKAVTSVFYGIDKGERIPDGYFRETFNMTSDKFPCLATRSERKNMKFGLGVQTEGEPVAAVDVDGAIAVLCSNGMIRCFGEHFDTRSYGRDVVRFNKKAFVLPSGAYLGSDGMKFPRAYLSGLFSCEARDRSGNSIRILTEKPANPSGGEYWYNYETEGIYRYSPVQGQWTAVPALYWNMKLQTADSDSGNVLDFNVGDGVKIHTVGENPDIQTFVAAVSETDGITVEADKPFVGEDYFSIERSCPEMQYAAVHNNRIWGCNFNDSVNEIYASKLGDPLNWNCFRELSTDSYAVSVGEPGEFTGCVSLGDSVIFFKEMCIYSVYGNEPSNFRTVKAECFGVQKGSEGSVVKINGQLYYKSCHGIMRMSQDSLPVCISDELGADVWKDAVAGTDGSKYYVVMTDAAGKREMFVYDTYKQSWNKESIPCEGVFAMIYHKNNLLLIGKKKTDLKAKSIRRIKEKHISRSDYESELEYRMVWLAESARRVTAGLYLNRTDEEIREILAQNQQKEISDEELYETLNTLYELEDCFVHELTFTYISNELTCNEVLLEDDERIAVGYDEGRFRWLCETGIRGFDASEYKRLKFVELRMKLGAGARCDVSIEYDSSGKWESVYSFEGEGMQTYRIRDRLDKCDTYRIRLSGYGKMVLFSIGELYEEAGNIGF